MPAASPPVLAPPGGPWRNAAEGALAATGAFAVMAATAWAALLALDADDIAPLSSLVPALLSLAFGGEGPFRGVAPGAAGRREDGR
jgi:hypothetical protein